MPSMREKMRQNKHGKSKAGSQRYLCKHCNKTCNNAKMEGSANSSLGSINTKQSIKNENEVNEEKENKEMGKNKMPTIF